VNASAIAKYFSKKILLINCYLCIFSSIATAQPGSEIEIKKPAKYERKILAAEKSNNKKFTAPKRFYQNGVTHYNYYFNANNRLNEVIANAKLSNKDDYRKLLPFYNFSLDATAQSTNDLDSVIYKCTAGIVLHNLNNDWVDNMYLLMGKAYYYRKNFDSAAAVFQYMNYAFAPKDDGYDVPIGSNASNTNGVFTIATKEHKSLWKKIVSHRPSRNQALLWLTKLMIETDNLGSAASMLQLLKKDPNFPKRLTTDFDEMMALWYYKSNVYDSAAAYLVKALPNANTKEEVARWQFLTAQLFERAGNNVDAATYYSKAANNTFNPVMEVAANLQAIKLGGGKKENAVDYAVDNLKKLAKKEKYTLHRDVIHYAIAQLEYNRKNEQQAVYALEKSIAFSQENPEQKALSTYFLGNIFYGRKQFIDAANYYDSLQVNNLNDTSLLAAALLKKANVPLLAKNLEEVFLQDSLQKIATYSPEVIADIVKKKYKELKKKEGIVLEETVDNFNPAVANQAPADLFGSPSKGDWYFNNTSLRSQGRNEFNTNWGKRPNQDNWRRQAALEKNVQNNAGFEDPDALSDVSIKKDSKQEKEVASTTLDGLMANIPTTPEKLTKSNNTIKKALLNNGKIFAEQLDAFSDATATYTNLYNRFPTDSVMQEAWYGAYFCYKRLGLTDSAAYAKEMLLKYFSNGNYTKKLTVTNYSPASNKTPATAAYERVYNLFLSGKFSEAEDEKKLADAKYDKSNWTPQLLYIEAIYFIKQEKDSSAAAALKALVAQHPSSPLASKAATMLEVLGRRKEIETYLTNLQITKKEEEGAPLVDLTTPTEIKKTSPIKPIETVVKSPVITTTAPIIIKKDSVVVATAAKQFSYLVTDQQFVAFVLKDVDKVFVKEALNAFTRFNKEKNYNQKFDYTITKINDSINFVLIGPLSDGVTAAEYVQKTKPLTASRIVPWLTADKYFYTIISKANLDLLLENKLLEKYLKMINDALPGKL